MPKLKMITVQGLECLRCGHQWVPKIKDVRICARCKSARFDTPRPAPGPRSKKLPMKKTA
jgi:predicted Zn-ribbon and HTH transcriptional regulator